MSQTRPIVEVVYSKNLWSSSKQRSLPSPSPPPQSPPPQQQNKQQSQQQPQSPPPPQSPQPLLQPPPPQPPKQQQEQHHQSQQDQQSQQKKDFQHQHQQTQQPFVTLPSISSFLPSTKPASPGSSAHNQPAPPERKGSFPSLPPIDFHRSAPVVPFTPDPNSLSRRSLKLPVRASFGYNDDKSVYGRTSSPPPGERMKMGSSMLDRDRLYAVERHDQSYPVLRNYPTERAPLPSRTFTQYPSSRTDYDQKTFFRDSREAPPAEVERPHYGPALQPSRHEIEREYFIGSERDPERMRRENYVPSSMSMTHGESPRWEEDRSPYMYNRSHTPPLASSTPSSHHTTLSSHEAFSGRYDMDRSYYFGDIEQPMTPPFRQEPSNMRMDFDRIYFPPGQQDRFMSLSSSEKNYYMNNDNSMLHGPIKVEENNKQFGSSKFAIKNELEPAPGHQPNSASSASISMANQPIQEVFTIDGEPLIFKRKRGRKPCWPREPAVNGLTFIAPTVVDVTPASQRNRMESSQGSGADHRLLMNTSNEFPASVLAEHHFGSQPITFTSISMDTVATSIPKKKRGRKPKNPIAGNDVFVWKEMSSKGSSSTGGAQLGPIILPKTEGELFFVPETTTPSINPYWPPGRVKKRKGENDNSRSGSKELKTEDGSSPGKKKNEINEGKSQSKRDPQAPTVNGRLVKQQLIPPANPYDLVEKGNSSSSPAPLVNSYELIARKDLMREDSPSLSHAPLPTLPPPRPSTATSVGEGDIAQQEQETIFILQTMMNHRNGVQSQPSSPTAAKLSKEMMMERRNSSFSMHSNHSVYSNHMPAPTPSPKSTSTPTPLNSVNSKRRTSNEPLSDSENNTSISSNSSTSSSELSSSSEDSDASPIGNGFGSDSPDVEMDHSNDEGSSDSSDESDEETTHKLLKAILGGGKKRSLVPGEEEDPASAKKRRRLDKKIRAAALALQLTALKHHHRSSSKSKRKSKSKSETQRKLASKLSEVIFEELGRNTKTKKSKKGTAEESERRRDKKDKRKKEAERKSRKEKVIMEEGATSVDEEIVISPLMKEKPVSRPSKKENEDVIVVPEIDNDNAAALLPSQSASANENGSVEELTWELDIPDIPEEVWVETIGSFDDVIQTKKMKVQSHPRLESLHPLSPTELPAIL